MHSVARLRRLPGLPALLLLPDVLLLALAVASERMADVDVPEVLLLEPAAGGWQQAQAVGVQFKQVPWSCVSSHMLCFV